MRFALTFELDNAAYQVTVDDGAFLNREAIAKTLEDAAYLVRNTFDEHGALHDDNGNTVGHWEIVT